MQQKWQLTSGKPGDPAGAHSMDLFSGVGNPCLPMQYPRNTSVTSRGALLPRFRHCTGPCTRASTSTSTHIDNPVRNDDFVQEETQLAQQSAHRRIYDSAHSNPSLLPARALARRVAPTTFGSLLLVSFLKCLSHSRFSQLNPIFTADIDQLHPLKGSRRLLLPSCLTPSS